MSSEIKADLIKDKSGTKTLATLSSSAVTLHSDVALATDNKNNNKSVSLVKTTGGAFDFPTTATELYNSDNSFRLTLPSVAGTYLILSTLRVRHLATTHDSLKVTIHTVGSSATNGAEAVSNSKRLLLEQTVKSDPDARTVNVSCSLNWVISGSAGQILTLYGQCDTASLGGVFVDSAGFCSLSAIRLGE